MAFVEVVGLGWVAFVLVVVGFADGFMEGLMVVVGLIMVVGLMVAVELRVGSS